MESKDQDAIYYFLKAKDYVKSHGYQREIDYVQNRYLKDISPERFAEEFTFVLCNSTGLKEQVARKNFDKFIEAKKAGHSDPALMVPNRFIQTAIRAIWSNNENILKIIKSYHTDEMRIDYISTLPRMGPVMKYHLARNIGIDTVKPDAWMNKLARRFDFPTPFSLCRFIQTNFPEYRIGTVDVILWRYCNLTGDA